MTTITVSTQGRITLPAEVRRRLGLAPQARLELEVRGEEILLRPARGETELPGLLSSSTTVA